MSAALHELRSELDDLSRDSARSLPLDNSCFSFGAADQKHVNGHRENKVTNRDMHVPADDFIFRNRSHPERQSIGCHTRITPGIRATADGAKQPRLINPLIETGFLTAKIAGKRPRHSPVCWRQGAGTATRARPIPSVNMSIVTGGNQ